MFAYASIEEERRNLAHRKNCGAKAGQSEYYAFKELLRNVIAYVLTISESSATAWMLLETIGFDVDGNWVSEGWIWGRGELEV